ncbi:MAG: hypothetical protein ACREIP_06260 [Alphaproteobacteria bacterium]
MTDQSLGLPVQPTPDQGRRAMRQLATVALLSVLLGFVMQGLILVAKLSAGGAYPGLLLLADLAQGVTWSFVVCTGVGVGVFLSKARASIAGAMAFIFAPIAVALAKSAQKVMNGILKVADQPAFLPLATISVLRAVEYGILGWMLAKLVQKDSLAASYYLATGIATGLVFGGVISFLTYSSSVTMGTAQTWPQISGMIMNEVGSPIGCALLIYTGQWIAHRHKLIALVGG